MAEDQRIIVKDEAYYKQLEEDYGLLSLKLEMLEAKYKGIVLSQGEIRKTEGASISYITRFWQDKNDKRKIWMVSKDILAPTEINNKEGSVNHHQKLYDRLSSILKEQGKWIEE